MCSGFRKACTTGEELGAHLQSHAEVTLATMACDSDEPHHNTGCLPETSMAQSRYHQKHHPRIRSGVESLQTTVTYSIFTLLEFLVRVLQRFRFSNRSRVLSCGWSHAPPYAHAHFSLPHSKLHYLHWFF